MQPTQQSQPTPPTRSAPGDPSSPPGAAVTGAVLGVLAVGTTLARALLSLGPGGGPAGSLLLAAGAVTVLGAVSLLRRRSRWVLLVGLAGVVLAGLVASTGALVAGGDGPAELVFVVVTQAPGWLCCLGAAGCAWWPSTGRWLATARRSRGGVGPA